MPVLRLVDEVEPLNAELAEVSAERHDYCDTVDAKPTILSTSPGEGLSRTQLCEFFNINSSNVARQAKKADQTSQQYLEERTGWRYEPSERKYYPPD